MEEKLRRLEERRGETQEQWMKKAGAQYFTKDDARVAAWRACDAEGIDPTLPLSERVARMQDIHQGSPLMFEERQRKERHQQAANAKHFHDTLRAKLGQS